MEQLCKSSGLARVLGSLGMKSSLWEKFPREATLVECRAFAKEHSLRLPVGLPQSKEAFVTMFMICHFTPSGLLKFGDLSLTQEHLKKIFAYCSERDKERHANGGAKKKNGEKFKSVAETSSAGTPTESVSMSTNVELKSKPGKNPNKPSVTPTTPSWPKRFDSKKAWHAHNRDSLGRFLARQKRGGVKEKTNLSLPISPATKRPFCSLEGLQACNRASQARACSSGNAMLEDELTAELRAAI